MIGYQDVRFFVALDLGAAGEYTALAVIERPYVHRSFPRAQRRPAHSLRYLRRFPIGMSYPEVFEELRQLIRKPPLPGCILGVDETGVGRSVASLLKDRLKHQVTCMYCPLTVVLGTAAPGPTHQIRKLELVGTLQVLLQTRRLSIPSSLPDADLLVRELSNFRTKPVVVPDDPLAAWRDGPHDDLVFAVAIAAWMSEQGLPPLHDD